MLPGQQEGVVKVVVLVEGVGMLQWQEVEVSVVKVGVGEEDLRPGRDREMRRSENS